MAQAAASHATAQAEARAAEEVAAYAVAANSALADERARRIAAEHAARAAALRATKEVAAAHAIAMVRDAAVAEELQRHAGASADQTAIEEMEQRHHRQLLAAMAALQAAEQKTAALELEHALVLEAAALDAQTAIDTTAYAHAAHMAAEAHERPPTHNSKEHTAERAQTGSVIATTANSTQFLIPMEQAAGEYLEPVARNEDYTYAPPFQPPVDPTLGGGPRRPGDNALDYAEVDDPIEPAASGEAAGGGDGGGGRLALDEDNYVAGGELPSDSVSPYTRPLPQYAVGSPRKGGAAAGDPPPTTGPSEYVADGYDASAAGVYGGVYGSSSSAPGIRGSASDYATPTEYATPAVYGDAGVEANQTNV